MTENEQSQNPEDKPATPEEQDIIEGMNQYVQETEDTRLDPEDELLEERAFDHIKRIPRVPPVPDEPPTPTAQRREEIRPPKPRRDRNA